MPNGSNSAAPLAGKCKLSALGGSIPAGAALPGQRHFRADIHNCALALFQQRKRVVGHRVVMQQVLAQALGESLRIAAGKANAVIRAGVIHKSVKTAVMLLDALNCLATLLRVSELRFDEFAAVMGQPASPPESA